MRGGEVFWPKFRSPAEVPHEFQSNLITRVMDGPCSLCGKISRNPIHESGLQPTVYRVDTSARPATPELTEAALAIDRLYIEDALSSRPEFAVEVAQAFVRLRGALEGTP